jgi:hypothetical protein
MSSSLPFLSNLIQPHPSLPKRIGARVSVSGLPVQLALASDPSGNEGPVPSKERSRVGGWLSLAWVFSLLCSNTLAQPSAIASKDAVDIAVDKGIDFLISKQRPDGAIFDRGYATAMTALSVMAMASNGTTLGEPTPRSAAMMKAVDYILRDELRDSQGYFGQKDDSRMYGHGIIALMLTELLGMGATAEQDVKLHECCRDAISLILRSQQVPKNSTHRGGWRYPPDATDSDLSVSVWQLMACDRPRTMD